jgi:hypothetical protein
MSKIDGKLREVFLEIFCSFFFVVDDFVLLTFFGGKYSN